MVKDRTHTVTQASALIQRAGLLALEHFEGSKVIKAFPKLVAIHRKGTNMGTFMRKGAYGKDVPVHQVKQGDLRFVYWWDLATNQPQFIELIHRKDAYHDA